eukprot:gene5068-34865_t
MQQSSEVHPKRRFHPFSVELQQAGGQPLLGTTAGWWLGTARHYSRLVARHYSRLGRAEEAEEVGGCEGGGQVSDDTIPESTVHTVEEKEGTRMYTWMGNSGEQRPSIECYGAGVIGSARVVGWWANVIQKRVIAPRRAVPNSEVTKGWTQARFDRDQAIRHFSGTVVLAPSPAQRPPAAQPNIPAQTNGPPKAQPNSPTAQTRPTAPQKPSLTAQQPNSPKAQPKTTNRPCMHAYEGKQARENLDQASNARRHVSSIAKEKTAARNVVNSALRRSIGDAYAAYVGQVNQLPDDAYGLALYALDRSHNKNTPAGMLDHNLRSSPYTTSRAKHQVAPYLPKQLNELKNRQPQGPLPENQPGGGAGGGQVRPAGHRTGYRPASAHVPSCNYINGERGPAFGDRNAAGAAILAAGARAGIVSTPYIRRAPYATVGPNGQVMRSNGQIMQGARGVQGGSVDNRASAGLQNRSRIPGPRTGDPVVQVPHLRTGYQVGVRDKVGELMWVPPHYHIAMWYDHGPNKFMRYQGQKQRRVSAGGRMNSVAEAQAVVARGHMVAGDGGDAERGRAEETTRAQAPASADDPNMQGYPVHGPPEAPQAGSSAHGTYTVTAGKPAVQQHGPSVHGPPVEQHGPSVQGPPHLQEGGYAGGYDPVALILQQLRECPEAMDRAGQVYGFGAKDRKPPLFSPGYSRSERVWPPTPSNYPHGGLEIGRRYSDGGAGGHNSSPAYYNDGASCLVDGYGYKPQGGGDYGDGAMYDDGFTFDVPQRSHTEGGSGFGPPIQMADADPLEAQAFDAEGALPHGGGLPTILF